MSKKKYEYEYTIGVRSNTSIDPTSMRKYMKDHVLAIRDKHNELEITDYRSLKTYDPKKKQKLKSMWDLKKEHGAI